MSILTTLNFLNIRKENDVDDLLLSYLKIIFLWSWLRPLSWYVSLVSRLYFKYMGRIITVQLHHESIWCVWSNFLFNWILSYNLPRYKGMASHSCGFADARRTCSCSWTLSYMDFMASNPRVLPSSLQKTSPAFPQNSRLWSFHEGQEKF